jgi:hypothetical protein
VVHGIGSVDGIADVVCLLCDAGRIGIGFVNSKIGLFVGGMNEVEQGLRRVAVGSCQCLIRVGVALSISLRRAVSPAIFSFFNLVFSISRPMTLACRHSRRLSTSVARVSDVFAAEALVAMDAAWHSEVVDGRGMEWVMSLCWMSILLMCSVHVGQFLVKYVFMLWDLSARWCLI